jgi:putative hydrolase of the HAD superfamily
MRDVASLSIKAVTFDLWETLLFERDGLSVRRSEVRSRNLAKAFNKFGFAVSGEQAAMALKEVISELVKVWDADKDVTHHDQLRLIVKHVLKGSASFKEELMDGLSAAYVSPIFEVPPHLNPETHEILEWLKELKKKVGLICNTGLTPSFALRQFLVREGAAEYFDVMVFSDEVCVRKPDERIFLAASHGLRVNPSEIVHVGDNLKSDVWGAKNAGMKTVHLSCDQGHDRIAEADPTSLVSLSRNLGSLKKKQLTPDKTITTLAMTKKAISELETER